MLTDTEKKAVYDAVNKIFKDECAKLSRLYLKPTADFQFAEKDELIKIALALQNTAMKTMITLFTKLNVLYPDTLWRRIEEQISIVSYMSCDWSRVSEMKAALNAKRRDRKVSPSDINKEGQRMIIEALDYNKEALKKWCNDLYRCTLTELTK